MFLYISHPGEGSSKLGHQERCADHNQRIDSNCNNIEGGISISFCCKLKIYFDDMVNFTKYKL